jgi:cell division control protein 24
LKVTSPEEYPHYEELKEGAASAKRITDKINESQRRAENIQTVRNLESRIEDWKGHHISNFGELLLEDIFIVTKSDVDREYHVFLFQRIILCCKELAQQPPNTRKVSKNNSILKKQVPPPATQIPSAGSKAKKSTPLLLKGRIFLNNVTQAVPKISAGAFFVAIPTIFVLRCSSRSRPILTCCLVARRRRSRVFYPTLPQRRTAQAMGNSDQ